MRSLCSLTANREAIRALSGVAYDLTGNLPPLLAIFLALARTTCL